MEKLTSIGISKEVKEKLDYIRKIYNYNTYNICVESISDFVISNKFNPKENYSGTYEQILREMEIRMKESHAEMFKKLSEDNTSLRKWVGAISKEYMIPIQKDVQFLVENMQNVILNNSQKKEENPQTHFSPLSFHDYDPDEEKKKEEKDKKTQEDYRELFKAYDEQKTMLRKIFDNTKIVKREKGMMGDVTEIIVNLSEEEWKEMKEKI